MWTFTENGIFSTSLEYVGREKPFLTACYEVDKNGELYNPRGIALDRSRNKVYTMTLSTHNRTVIFKLGYARLLIGVCQLYI